MLCTWFVCSFLHSIHFMFDVLDRPTEMYEYLNMLLPYTYTMSARPVVSKDVSSAYVCLEESFLRSHWTAVSIKDVGWLVHFCIFSGVVFLQMFAYLFYFFGFLANYNEVTIFFSVVCPRLGNYHCCISCYEVIFYVFLWQKNEAKLQKKQAKIVPLILNANIC